MDLIVIRARDMNSIKITSDSRGLRFSHVSTQFSRNSNKESYPFEGFIKSCINANSVIFSIFIFTSFFKWHEIFREHKPDYFFDMCKIDDSMKNDNFCEMIFDISGANSSYFFANYVFDREDWAEGNKTLLIERLTNCYLKFFSLEPCYVDKATNFLDGKMSEYYANVRTYIFVFAILLAVIYYHFCITDERMLFDKYDKETYKIDKKCFFRHCGLNVLVWISALAFFTDLFHYNSMYLHQFWYRCDHPQPFQMSCANGSPGKYFYSWTFLISLLGYWVYRNAGRIPILHYISPQYATLDRLSRSMH